ncbi:hypothetical protein JCM6882_003889 [Rhodosporidiobolus microsporus]
MSPSDLPDTFAQLKYVLFSWPNTPLLKRDGLAKAWFKANATMSTFASSLGGYPLTVYEASLHPSTTGGSGAALGVPELFLSQADCQRLIAALAEEMGPSRAQASWKETAWHRRAALERGSPGGQIRVHKFADQEALENRFAELKDQDDWAASRPHWRDLKRAQEVWARMHDGARLGGMSPLVVSLDFETWEADHDAITEVGIASVRIRRDGSYEERAEHYVVAENAHRRNGRYCPDARDDFQFGTTSTLPTSSLSAHLRQLLSVAYSPPPPPASASAFPSGPPAQPTDCPLLLLLHDPRGDLVSLAQLDLQMNLFERNLPPASAFTVAPRSFSSALTSPSPSSNPSSNPSSRHPPTPRANAPPPANAYLLDTQRLYSGWSRRKKQVRLEDACAALGVTAPDGKTPLKPHNAGNDAYGTLQAFLRLMSAHIGASADEIPPAMLAAASGGGTGSSPMPPPVGTA